MNDVTPQQGREALEDIEKIGQKICYAAGNWAAGPILITWGLIWIACYSISHFANHITNWAWLVGNAVGIPLTIWFGWIANRRGPVLSESEKQLSKRLGWFWSGIFIFGAIWLTVLHPWAGHQLSVFISTLIMFAYVVMGLWLEDRFWVRLGLLVTAEVLVGYFGSMIYPGYLGLYLAAVGGGTLLVAGGYLKIKCSR
ncbi:MAG: hypothetical protein KAR11_06240 [Phycisphaerae bacterium]|nr:hypothetical protein [Phycisphaerae bacterium]